MRRKQNRGPRARAAAHPDRRSSPRRPPRGSTLRSAALPVKLLDVSDQGLAIESRTALRVGASYPFSLESRRTTQPFSGRVLWCRLHRTERGANGDIHAVYRAGIRRLGNEPNEE